MFENMRKSAETFEALLKKFTEENGLAMYASEDEEKGIMALLFEDAAGHRLAEEVLLVELMQSPEQPGLIMDRIAKHWAEASAV